MVLQERHVVRSSIFVEIGARETRSCKPTGVKDISKGRVVFADETTPDRAAVRELPEG